MTPAEELIAEAHANREGEQYPDAQQLLKNLPVVLRGLCDYTLSGQATAFDIARALASIIDVVENTPSPPPGTEKTMH